MKGYEFIKEAAARAGRPVTDMLAMSRGKDPFYAGSAGDWAKARWFHGLWRKFRFGTGVHLRRVHYQLVSQVGAQTHDGRPYQNTESCWGYLCDCGKAARYLGLIPAEAFVDRRNPDAHINASYWSSECPSVEVGSSDINLPRLDPSVLAGDFEIDLTDPYVSGYRYTLQPSDCPFHLEVWVEKSTMNDVLGPLCREWDVNLVTSAGFQSITGVVEGLRRVQQSGRPTRIFYVSDFDPAGDWMPLAVARQMEFWRDIHAPQADIRLLPLVLTKDQVSDYSLPPVPIKESDLRRANFEARRDVEGAVELDAMEALHPGALAAVLTEAIMPFRDPSIRDRLHDAERQAEEIAIGAWAEQTADERIELDDIREDARPILARYCAELTRLAEGLSEELAPVQDRLDSTMAAVARKAREFQTELPKRPSAECPEADVGGDWLLDTTRGYADQLAVYQRRTQAGGDDGD